MSIKLPQITPVVRPVPMAERWYHLHVHLDEETSAMLHWMPEAYQGIGLVGIKNRTDVVRHVIQRAFRDLYAQYESAAKAEAHAAAMLASTSQRL